MKRTWDRWDNFIGSVHSYACTVDGDDWRFYIDGEPLSMIIYLARGGFLPLFYASNASSEALPDTYTNTYTIGLIDEVAIFDRALDDVEISMHYDPTTSGAVVRLQRAWKHFVDTFIKSIT